MKKITISLSTNDLEMLAGMFENYKQVIDSKADELAEALAKVGKESAELGFAQAYYEGKNDVSVNYEHRGDGVYAVVASGNAATFIEFGAGMIGVGHPEPHGMTPGSYSDTVGKGQWKNPEGWIWSHHEKRSFGNPPARAMWEAKKELETRIKYIAEGVLQF